MVVRHVLEASYLLVDRKQSKDKSGQYKMCSLKTLPSDLLPPLRPHLPILCSACVRARVCVRFMCMWRPEGSILSVLQVQFTLFSWDRVFRWLGTHWLARLVGQWTPRIFLSLLPQCLNCKHVPPLLACVWGFWGSDSTHQACLYNKHFFTEPSRRFYFYLCLYVHVCVHSKLILFLEGSGCGTQVVRLGSKSCRLPSFCSFETRCHYVPLTVLEVTV